VLEHDHIARGTQQHGTAVGERDRLELDAAEAATEQLGHRSSI
jgi:hypothetical protein